MTLRWGFIAVVIFATGAEAFAQSDSTALTDDVPDILRLIIVLTAITLIPALLLSMTCMARILIVLAMVRHAFGMPETPPNQILISIALFLTLFVMGPTFSEIADASVIPLMDGQISVNQASQDAVGPLKAFMIEHVNYKDLQAIYAYSGEAVPTTQDNVDVFKLVPAFIISEIRTAFAIGFLIMLPFLLIALVVASILLSLGMMMVPPATISLPIKLLMFVLIDGWALVIDGLMRGLL